MKLKLNVMSKRAKMIQNICNFYTKYLIISINKNEI